MEDRPHVIIEIDEVQFPKVFKGQRFEPSGYERFGLSFDAKHLPDDFARTFGTHPVEGIAAIYSDIKPYVFESDGSLLHMDGTLRRMEAANVRPDALLSGMKATIRVEAVNVSAALNKPSTVPVIRAIMISSKEFRRKLYDLRNDMFGKPMPAKVKRGYVSNDDDE